MSLKKICIKNFKLIETAIIEPGKINQIVGKNNQGKTTVLEAIQFAMLGSTDENIIKHGEHEAIVELAFSDGLQVSRKLSRKSGQDLKVELNDMSPQRPQSYLNGLIGVGTFNPNEVLDPKKRKEYLLNSINLKVKKRDIENITGKIAIPDFNYDDHGLKVIERAAKWFYDARTVANKETKKAKGEAEVYENNLGDLPEDITFDCDIDHLNDLLKQYKEKLKGLSLSYDEWKYRKEAIEFNNKTIENMDNKIIETREKLDAQIDKRQQVDKINNELVENLGVEPDVVQVASETTEQIETINNELTLRKAHAAYEKESQLVGRLHARAEELDIKAKNLGTIYKSISNGLMSKVMADADLPIKGLSYEDGDFKLDGINVEQLSSSKTLSLALAITKKLNKKANLICIDGIELLDENTYNELNKEMLKDDFNYFLSKVGPAFKNSQDKVIEMSNGGVQ